MMPTNDSDTLLPSSAETLSYHDVHHKKARTALAARRLQLLSLKTARDERSTNNIIEPRLIKEPLISTKSAGFFDLPMDDEEDEDPHDASFLTPNSTISTSS